MNNADLAWSHEVIFSYRGPGQQSISSLDEAEEELLLQPLAPGLAAVPDNAAHTEPELDLYHSSDRTGTLSRPVSDRSNVGGINPVCLQACYTLQSLCPVL